MSRHLAGLAGALILFMVLFYTSRFWIFAWWDRPGLFGQEGLPPGGDLVARWTRGTPWQPYSLLLWAIGAFAVLSAVQMVLARLRPGQD